MNVVSEYMTVRRVLVLGCVIRFAMLAYGTWQDANLVVKYTDVDYRVFLDGSKALHAGGSPYERSTYRYTPMLAYLLLPSVLIHEVVGKAMFVIMDVLVGVLLVRIIRLIYPAIGESSLAAYLSLWCLNPVVINISTRGNAECVVALSVLYCLHCSLTGRHRLGAFMFGLSVHLKLFPIIYSVPFALYTVALHCGDQREDQQNLRTRSMSSKRKLGSWSSDRSTLLEFIGQWQMWVGPFVQYTAISVCSCLLWGLLMYFQFGYPFLEHSYLYHFSRVDHRHNFSLYFYSLYLTGQDISWGVLAFLPQIVLVLYFGFAYLDPRQRTSQSSRTSLFYARQLVFCIFIQTFAFVSFNKVCTVQYFVWYISLLPLVSPFLAMSRGEAVVLFFAWQGGQLLWLTYAYYLEFRGKNTFLNIWVAGQIFFLINVYIIIRCVRSWSPLIFDPKRSLANRMKNE